MARSVKMTSYSRAIKTGARQHCAHIGSLLVVESMTFVRRDFDRQMVIITISFRIWSGEQPSLVPHPTNKLKVEYSSNFQHLASVNVKIATRKCLNQCGRNLGVSSQIDMK